MFTVFAGPEHHSLILADSLTKNFFKMHHTKVITRRAATPKKLIDYIQEQPDQIHDYRVIVLHVGTNCLSGREEWGLYLKLVNDQISQESYDAKLKALNPPDANDDPESFKNIYQQMIDEIRAINKNATILVSAIIPRFWDHDRRHQVRRSYNCILKDFNSQDKVFFIPSYRPFFNHNQNLKKGYLTTMASTCQRKEQSF